MIGGCGGCCLSEWICDFCWDLNSCAVLVFWCCIWSVGFGKRETIILNCDYKT